MPRTAGVIAAHHVPMLLHEQRFWPRRMHCNPMYAVTDFRVWVGNVLRVEPAIDWLPRPSAIVGTKRAGSRDRNKDSLGIVRIEKNGMQTHPARAGLPFWTGLIASESRQFMP